MLIQCNVTWNVKKNTHTKQWTLQYKVPLSLILVNEVNSLHTNFNGAFCVICWNTGCWWNSDAVFWVCSVVALVMIITPTRWRPREWLVHVRVHWRGRKSGIRELWGTRWTADVRVSIRIRRQTLKLRYAVWQECIWCERRHVYSGGRFLNVVLFSDYWLWRCWQGIWVRQSEESYQ